MMCRWAWVVWSTIWSVNRACALAPLARRALLQRCIGTVAVVARPAVARNLPESTGAVGDKRGTAGALVPVVRMQRAVDDAASAVKLGDVKRCQNLLATLPPDEKSFKRLFDEYSDAVSYKTKFMDQNAFLVYYTQGFDGPGRPRMEDDAAPTRQSKQFGFRNDAWTAVDDARAEAAYLLEERAAVSNDLRSAVDAARGALGEGR